jgi:peptidyl-prolyl cis-trans isomerase SurA
MEPKLMTLNGLMKATLGLVCLAVVLVAGVPKAFAQQDGFAPKAYVGARVISQYEYKQRVLMMTLLRQPGDISALALSGLIDDALKRGAAKALDVTVSPDAVNAAMTEFAGRANLPLEEFLKALAQNGVEAETLRDFVEAGLLWRGVIRTKFAESTHISDAEIDRALAAGAGSGGERRVLLSEIVLPTGGKTDAMTLAQRIRLTATTEKTFGVAARNYSKADSAKAGGALGWIGASALPPAVAGQVLALKVGEVSEPIEVQGAVQLYFLRDISVADGAAKGAPEVEYVLFAAPAGTDLARVQARLDRCDDIYTAARGLPTESLQRMTVLEAGLPANLRNALAGLDAGESVVLPGAVPTLVMLCARRPQSDISPSRADISGNLLNSKLGQIAETYMTELKSNTFIRIP